MHRKMTEVIVRYSFNHPNHCCRIFPIYVSNKLFYMVEFSRNGISDMIFGFPEQTLPLLIEKCFQVEHCLSKILTV